MSGFARRRAGFVPFFVPLAGLLWANSLAAAGDVVLRPYHELAPDRPLLALTPGLEGPALADVLDRLEAAGLRIPVAVAGAGIVVADGPGVGATLRTEHEVTAVLRDSAPSARSGADLAQRGLLHWWNEGFELPAPAPEPPGAREGVEICAGARPLDDVLAERAGTNGLRCGPNGYGRTHFVQGRSIVNLIYPESEGPASVADWEDRHLESTLGELVRACNWWSLKSGYSASFVIVNHGLARTDTEPAFPTPDDELGYIADCVADLGFPDACGYAGLDRLNEEMKARYRGHWSWTQFILNADGFVGTTAIAYAYLGGPHTVATRGNGSLPPGELDRVIAHEMGHIYQALDEYASGCGGCSGAAGYLDVPNNNCVSCILRESRCVMRGGSEYTSAEAANMEAVIHPCRFTKGMVGLWDLDRDGIADILETYPDTRIDTVLPDTLETSRNVPIVGEAWDVPYPAPPRYADPQTINTIQSVEYSVDNAQWRRGAPIDGFFTERRESWILQLPELGGGRHRLRVRGVNTVSLFDRAPAQLDFLVYDVKLRRDLDIVQDPGGMVIAWQVEGEDFGGSYHLYRRQDRGEEVAVATIPSRGGRHDRHRFLDGGVRAGHSYLYRLEVDIPGKGTKNLSTGEAIAVLPDATEGSSVAVAPNPSTGAFLFTISIPRGPRPGTNDPVFPEDGSRRDGVESSGSGDLRGPGDPEDPRSPFTPLWRDVSVSVFDVRGRRVRDLGLFRERETSRFNLGWDGQDDEGRPLPSGIYFLLVDVGFSSDVMKITMVR